MGEHVAELVSQGFLKATSVGFRPLALQPSSDPARKYGIDFLEQELLEFSIVSIPANAEALIRPKHAPERQREIRQRKLRLLQLRGTL